MPVSESRAAVSIIAGIVLLVASGCGGGTSMGASPTPAPSPAANPSPNPTTNSASNLWTWVAGSSAANQSGKYGTLRTPAAANTPGARDAAASWIDDAGDLWLFGGETAPSSSTDNDFNDLWKYSAGQWTWMGGSSNFNQQAIYGLLGVAAPGNIPGARTGAVTWKDRSGNLWLFGGLGLGAFQNDFWKYSSGQWTWMGGSQFGIPGTGVYGDKGIASPGNIPGARSMAVSWTDASGNFWLFGGLGLDSTGALGKLNDLWKYSDGEWTWMAGASVVNQPGEYGLQGISAPDNTPGARLEASGWTDAAGNLWLFGGTSGGNTFAPFNDLWKYSDGQWTWVKGSDVPDQPGVYGVQGTAADSNEPGARVSAVTWRDTNGNLWLFGGDGYDSNRGVGELNDIWKYSAGEWTWVGGSKVLGQSGTYGRMGIASAENIPGARSSATTWQDGSGTVWLFGGNGSDINNMFGFLNDLWQFHP